MVDMKHLLYKWSKRLTLNLVRSARKTLTTALDKDKNGSKAIRCLKRDQ